MANNNSSNNPAPEKTAATAAPNPVATPVGKPRANNPAPERGKAVPAGFSGQLTRIDN